MLIYGSSPGLSETAVSAASDHPVHPFLIAIRISLALSLIGNCVSGATRTACSVVAAHLPLGILMGNQGILLVAQT